MAERDRAAILAGEPRQYTRIRSPENAEMICQMIAGGWSIKQIAVVLECNDRAIHHWRNEDAIFSAQYEKAKLDQMDYFAEELLEIADDASNDWMEREGKTELNVEHVARSRMRLDTRKWLMAKMAPIRFGDKQIHEHAGTVAIDHTTLEDRRKRARAIIDAAFEEVLPDGKRIEAGPVAEVAAASDEGEVPSRKVRG